MVMRRRRPLLRGAMLAGAGTAAYRAGRRREARDEHESQQDQQLESLSQAPPADATQPAASGGGTVDQLERLKQLLDEGALSQAEYQSAKQQVLGGG
ncbi:MAG TPA: SHOCT domain-containing protein [Actinomycetes bacterium]